MVKDIKVYTATYCGYCTAAKQLLQRLNLPFEEVNLDHQPELRRKLSEENNGYRTVPMIVIDGVFIGGYMDLLAMHQQGQLMAGT